MLRLTAVLLLCGIIHSQFNQFPQDLRFNLQNQLPTQFNGQNNNFIPQQAIEAQQAAQQILANYGIPNFNIDPMFLQSLSTLNPMQNMQNLGQCPALCKCLQFGGPCSSCLDIQKNISTNCVSCLEPKTLKNGVCVNPPCPNGCKCTGFVPWTCTTCIDPQANFSSSCDQCNLGYYKPGKICILQPISAICPVVCKCAVNSGVCLSCKGINLDPASKCKRCKEGFSLNTFGVCISNCPKDCICKGTVPNICTECKDPKKNLKQKCSTCNDGYTLQADTSTCVTLPCPKNCVCTGINPSVCTKCNDLNAQISKNCISCKPGYSLNSSNLCVAGECPTVCNCNDTNPTVCTTCKDPKKNLSSICITCMNNWSLDDTTGVCEADSVTATQATCPTQCNCDAKGLCTSCKSPSRMLSLSCNYCSPGYNLVDTECIKGCFSGCNCDGLDKTICSSCVAKTKDPESFCICEIGKTFNIDTNMCV